MMVSIEDFYEYNLKNKTLKEIMKVIRGLKQEIGRLKNIVEHPFYDDREWQICPDERTQIYFSQLYLERAKQALFEAGGKYEPSNAEQKAIEFNTNIPYINKVVFSIGGFFSGHKTKTYVINDDEICVNVADTLGMESSNEFMQIDISKEKFLEHLADLKIGEWRNDYNTFRFNVAVMDGTQWELEFYFTNKHKAVKIKGSNAYPYNFDRLLELFKIANQ